MAHKFIEDKRRYNRERMRRWRKLHPELNRTRDRENAARYRHRKKAKRPPEEEP